MNRDLRQAVLERDRRICQACGRPTSGQVHHICPRGQGGADSLRNLMLLCGRCHMLISPVPEFALWRAFRIKAADIPAARARVTAAIERFTPPEWPSPQAPPNQKQSKVLLDPRGQTEQSSPPVATQKHRGAKWWREFRTRAGTLWTAADDADLLRHVSTGLSPSETAIKLQRGDFAVEVRLIKLGWNHSK